jgi:hypothetical protein
MTADFRRIALSLAGRSCGSCHLASDGMGLSVISAQLKFISTRGNDPLFAAVDGANCPNTASQDPSTHSLLLKSGLIRVFLPVPATAQFQIQACRDPLRLRHRHRADHRRADRLEVTASLADHESAISKLRDV